TFAAQLPARATGRLGFLQLDVTAGQGPQLRGDLSVHLVAPNPSGKVSLADLTAPSVLDLGVHAAADVRLHLSATFGGNRDLPHLDTDFRFSWSLDPSVPTAVGFSDVTLDLGGFVDGVVRRIGDVLKPIKPAADVLSTPLPP